jgi:hypothetical protein
MASERISKIWQVKAYRPPSPRPTALSDYVSFNTIVGMILIFMGSPLSVTGEPLLRCDADHTSVSG